MKRITFLLILALVFVSNVFAEYKAVVDEDLDYYETAGTGDQLISGATPKEVFYDTDSDVSYGFHLDTADPSYPNFTLWRGTTNDLYVGDNPPLMQFDNNNDLFLHRGGLDVNGHSAFGADATIDQDIDYFGTPTTARTILNTQETFTSFPAEGYTTGVNSYVNLNPSADTTDASQFAGLFQLITPAANTKNMGYMSALAGWNLHYGSGNAQQIVGVDFEVQNLGIGTIDDAYGCLGGIANISTGIITNAEGIDATITNSVGGEITTAYGLKTFLNNGGTGTIGTGYGVFVKSTVNGGTFLNNYGLYIQDQSAVGSVNSYNLYSAGATAKNYFAGSIGIGVLNPTEKLEVDGNVKIGQGHRLKFEYGGIYKDLYFDETSHDFILTDDLDFEDPTPHIGGRDTDDNSAYQIHYDTADPSYPGWALFHGTNDGTNGFKIGSANAGYPSIWVDTSYNVKIPYSNFYVGANRIPNLVSKSFGLIAPIATDDYPIWRVPYAITIKAIHILCVGGTNIIGGLDETDLNGLNAVAIDSDITSLAGVNANDDGSLTNPTLDAGDYLFWHTTSISSTPTSVTVTIEFTVD